MLVDQQTGFESRYVLYKLDENLAAQDKYNVGFESFMTSQPRIVTLPSSALAYVGISQGSLQVLIDAKAAPAVAYTKQLPTPSTGLIHTATHKGILFVAVHLHGNNKGRLSFGSSIHALSIE